MALSRQSIENLLDLVEIKLSCLEVVDRDDARELKLLETCRDELMGLRLDAHARGRRARAPVVALHG